MDLHDFRRDYLLGGLRRADLADNPFVQFEQWFKAIVSLDTLDPNAMVLATVDHSATVNQRIVLLKAFDSEGFDFYTNKNSDKAQALVDNPQVSLHFPWHAVERQVKIQGIAEPLADSENDEYFASRPRESQLAAWASEQSQVIESREVLMSRFAALDQQYPDVVPRPPHWGGYKVKALSFEFWQGGASRLHDRFRYTLQDKGQWLIQRLAP